MKLLLDESLPRRLKDALEEHEVVTVSERGWSGTSNGELLELAGRDFDVFITADQGLPHQQNLVNQNIGVVILTAHTNRLDDLLPLVPSLLESLKTIAPGDVIRVTA